MNRWQISLCAGLLAAAGILLLPVGAVRDVAFLIVGTCSMAAVVVGIRRNRPANPTAWYLIVAGGVSWVVADGVYTWIANATDSPPFPSAADVFYLVGYPLLAAGVLSLVRSRNRERWSVALLDSTTVTVAIGLCSWVYVVEPAWAAGDAAPLARLVAVAYPLGDVLLIAVLVRLTTTMRRWGVALRLLVLSFAALVMADSAFSLATFVPVVETHIALADAPWLAAYVLWGASATHPSMRALSDPAPDHVDPMQTRRLLALVAVTVVIPGILVAELFGDGPRHTVAVLVAGTAMMLLVFARMLHLLRGFQDQAARLSLLADTDYVTGLANRRRFTAQVGTRLDQDHREGALLVLIDIERFTDINQSLGQATGDLILRAVGDRLTELAGPAGTVACMGGDTFGLLDSSVRGAASADAAVARIRHTLEQPYRIDGLTVSLDVSIGFLVGPDDCGALATVLHHLEVALVAAKSRPGRTARFRAEMEPGGSDGPMRGELATAIDHGELVLHYQPQIETATGRVLGVEALVRWQHPTRGLLGPDQFISAAEQTGLIGPLTQYVLDRALMRCALWRRGGLELTVAVNLSVRNLLDPGLVGDVRDALLRHGLGAEALELEITESSAMVDPRRSTLVLGELAEMGVMLSIDDFGTGHSSLAYLKHLPVGRLKIDRSFVAGVLTDPASAAIVSSTIDLARHLHLDVVAEGVEDDETLLSLREMRCWAAQGFGIGRPVPGADLPALVARIEARLPGVLAPLVA